VLFLRHVQRLYHFSKIQLSTANLIRIWFFSPSETVKRVRIRFENMRYLQTKHILCAHFFNVPFLFPLPVPLCLSVLASDRHCFQTGFRSPHSILTKPLKISENSRKLWKSWMEISNPLNTEVTNINAFCTNSSYRAVNTPRLGCNEIANAFCTQLVPRSEHATPRL
jgi:hypothetical protein